MQIYSDYNLKVGLLQLFNNDVSTNLFNHFSTTLDWSNDNRRQKFLFGDDNLIYSVKYRGKQTDYQVLPWTQTLLDLKDIVQTITRTEGTSLVQHTYTVCSIQRYPHGGVGINPHRDKEMKLGTSILGLSLGAERNLVLTRGDKSLILPLPSGSVYILYPPTNNYWLHSIPKDGSTSARISLTFRNY